MLMDVLFPHVSRTANIIKKLNWHRMYADAAAFPGWLLPGVEAQFPPDFESPSADPYGIFLTHRRKEKGGVSSR